MKRSLIATVLAVVALSANASSQSSSAILAESSDGSSAAIRTASGSVSDAVGALYEAASESSNASLSQGNAGRALDVIGAGVSGSSVTLAVGLRDSASQSGQTLSTSAQDSVTSTSAAASAAGRWVRTNVFAPSGAAISASVDASKSLARMAVDASGNVYAFSRDNVVQPIYGLSYASAVTTSNSASRTVRVIASGETSNSASASVAQVWEVMVSASGEVFAFSRDLASRPSETIGRVVDASGNAIRFVASNTGEFITSASDAVLLSLEGASASGQNLVGALSTDGGAVSANVVQYSEGVAAISVNASTSRGNRRVATVFLENPANTGHSRLYHR